MSILAAVVILVVVAILVVYANLPGLLLVGALVLCLIGVLLNYRGRGGVV